MAPVAAVSLQDASPLHSFYSYDFNSFQGTLPSNQAPRFFYDVPSSSYPEPQFTYPAMNPLQNSHGRINFRLVQPQENTEGFTPNSSLTPSSDSTLPHYAQPNPLFSSSHSLRSHPPQPFPFKQEPPYGYFSDSIGQAQFGDFAGMTSLFPIPNHSQTQSFATYKPSIDSSFDISNLVGDDGDSPKSSSGAIEEMAANTRHRQSSITSMSNQASNQCSECMDKLAQKLKFFEQFTAIKKGKSGDNFIHRDIKKQNEFLMQYLVDHRGELRFHAKCIVKAFKISKGRLGRIRDKKRRLLRGVDSAKHGLCGKPSNNRKHEKTLEEFIEFVLLNRVRIPNPDSDVALYQLSSKFKRVQGDGNDSVRGLFNIRQKDLNSPQDVRQTLSNGTAQGWFNKYFSADTSLVNANCQVQNWRQKSSTLSSSCLSDDSDSFPFDSASIELQKQSLLACGRQDPPSQKKLGSSLSSSPSPSHSDQSCTYSTTQNSLDCDSLETQDFPLKKSPLLHEESFFSIV
eukprot:Sdes_comp16021_c0_seq1m5204